MAVFLKYPSGILRCMTTNSPTTILDIKREVADNDSFYFINNGKLVDGDDIIPNDSTVHIVPRLFGGKGGFGSMLRAIGAQIEKTTNHEACRDLSGRRMRDVNNEKKLRDWVGKQAEREQEKEERRRLRRERRRAVPKHNFHDPLYEAQKSKALENLDEALQEGLKSVAGTSGESSQKSGKKRKATSTETDPSKKARDWLGMDIDPDALSETDSEEDSSSESGPSQGPLVEDGSPGPSAGDGSPEPSFKVGSPGPSAEDGQSSSSGSHHPPTQDVVDEKGQERKEQSASKPENDNKPQEGTPSSGTNATTDDVPNAMSGTETPQESTPSSGTNATTDDVPNAMSSTESKPMDSTPSSGTNVTTDDVPHAMSGTESKDPDSSTDQAEPAASSMDEPISQDRVDKDVGSVEVKVTEHVTKQVPREVDLDSYSGVSQLEDLGLDTLKTALMARGMKCGGSLTERAKRLYSVKGLSPDKIPASLLTKGGKIKGKGKK